MSEPLPNAIAVVLTGPSSSGKSTIAEAFAAANDRRWLRVDADRYLSGYSWHLVDRPASVARSLNAALFGAVRAALDEGLNVICEQVFWGHDKLLDAARRLPPETTILAKTWRPLADLERREHDRPDRDTGTSAHQATELDWDFPVDVILNDGDVDANVLTLADRLRSGPPTAISRLLTGTPERSPER